MFRNKRELYKILIIQQHMVAYNTRRISLIIAVRLAVYVAGIVPVVKRFV